MAVIVLPLLAGAVFLGLWLLRGEPARAPEGTPPASVAEVTGTPPQALPPPVPGQTGHAGTPRPAQLGVPAVAPAAEPAPGPAADGAEARPGPAPDPQPGAYIPERVAGAPPDPVRGAELAGSLCAGCHAIESGALESPVPDAPPFWTFRTQWPLDHLEEALAEGIMVSNPNHPMPVFQFEPADIDDLIAFLGTLKGPAPETTLSP
ncbi:MAG: cytochrome c [Alphaproteobacteria bacterium]|nr:cytochrome c [Alphaproteobacteria bacterium]